jgi:small neutral amino acid transporter SnatA (MarC family)
MLQWKPKSIALVAILMLVAALLGQFGWESFGLSVEQFTWS